MSAGRQLYLKDSINSLFLGANNFIHFSCLMLLLIFSEDGDPLFNLRRV